MKCSLAAAAKSLQWCSSLCDPIEGSSPGSAVPGILQARILEWVAISFSNAWKRKVKVKSLSCVRLLGTPWTAAYQAPPSMDFPGKRTGVGCLCLLQKCFLGISNVLEEISSLSHSVVFLYFFALIAEEDFLISSCYTLEFSIKMLIFPFLLWFLLLFFSQLFVRPPQTAILPFCISFPWGWSWSLSPVQCHESHSIVHQALYLSDLGP